jgi:hypothetical protein
VLKKKIWANFQRIIELFTPKIVNKLSKIWVWDPGSGKNLFRIPDPGSRGQKVTGSRIRIRNTEKQKNVCLIMLKLTISCTRYVELEQCLASTAGLREQLEQEAAAARQEAAQAQEEARMAQVC